MNEVVSIDGKLAKELGGRVTRRCGISQTAFDA